MSWFDDPEEAIRFADAILSGGPVSEPSDPDWWSRVEGDGIDYWQALLDVGDFVESQPMIWPLVAKWGCDAREDIRTAVGVVLLERLLEHHFDELFPRVEELARAEPRFLDTFSRCWKLGQAKRTPENSTRFDALMDAIEREGQAS